MRSQRAVTLFAILLCAIAIFLLVPLIMQLSVQSDTYTNPDDAPSAQVAIVLGASAKKNAPSPVLAARADGAIALFERGKVEKILVTGDSAEPTYDEVAPVKAYLLEAGIPPQDIFLDHSGFDTYSSMYRARHDYGVTSAIVVTQDFHMPRALFLAKHVGIRASGLITTEGESPPYDYAREIPASWKALADLLTQRVPIGSGATTSLAVDGRSTW